MKFLFHNGDQYVARHSAPDLRLDRVLAVAQEFLDSEVLLDPLEEHFDLPAILVKRGNRQGRERKVVGQKDQRFACQGVFEPDPSQLLWIVSRGKKSGEHHRLIADEAAWPLGSPRIDPVHPGIGFGSGDKERATPMHRKQTSKVEVAAVHDIERTRFHRHDVEHVDVVHLAVADVNESQDASSKIEQCMHLNRCFGLSKADPVEQTQAQVDRGGVQCIDCVLELEGRPDPCRRRVCGRV